MQIRDIRTDLAMEAYGAAAGAGAVSGAQVMETEAAQGVTVTEVLITDEEGERALGKPKGKYISIDAPGLRGKGADYSQSVSRVFAAELKKLLGDIAEDDCVLIAGLGNSSITADALGPKTVERVAVSRHITEYLPQMKPDGLRPVCALSPGVLGVTGIETGEILKGVSQHVKPAAIIAIDALASRSTERISTTIQLADTGIRPGSGIGNDRLELTKNTLGAKVIAAGVPTVVYASTISRDAVELLVQATGQGDADNAEELAALAAKVVNEKIGPLVVTPKDIDVIIDDCATLLANGIDMALHGTRLGEMRSTLT